MLPRGTIMGIQFDAVYENGVFRPLEPVPLSEHQRVTVTVDPAAANSSEGDQTLFLLPPERWRAFCDALDAPPRDIPALRKLLTEASLFDDHGTTAGETRPARQGP
jgi:predicted DNA-binding antitoxin AbrB/MazE fold protein